MSRTRQYKIWQGIRERCNNPKNQYYHNYGGRGIRVCSEWDSASGFNAFHVWAQASGYSDDLTIDRKENDGNYEPDNCQWATIVTQANNRRDNHVLTFRGETKTASEFARQYGLKVPTVFARLRHGWPVEKIFTTTPRDWGR